MSGRAKKQNVMSIRRMGLPGDALEDYGAVNMAEMF